MPQLDLYVALSQVFWFTVVFIVFYLFIVRDILPELARSIKFRKKKIGNNFSTSFDDELLAVLNQRVTFFTKYYKESQILLVKVSTSTSDWLDSSLKEVNESSFIDLNKKYIKIIGELKGRSYLLEQAIKQK